MMSNYVIVVYMSFWSRHVHGSHSIYLLKSGVTKDSHEHVLVRKKAFALSSLSRNAKFTSKRHLQISNFNLQSWIVITGFNTLRIHINVCTFNEWLNRRYNWGNTNGAENRTLQKVILHSQKAVHEQENEMELTELFVNIINLVFRRAVLLSKHK
jgi:hypothetical protein